MRQVFTSARLENVEGVERLLREAGIEVRITHGRSFEGSRRRRFSYSDNDSPLPAVWVVRSDDQVRARVLLRDAGLLDTTRGSDGATANPFRFEPLTQKRKPQRRVLLFKVALMGGIALVMVLGIVHTLNAPTVPQVASPPFDGAVARTLQPLAQAVFASQLDDADLPVLCLSVDGKDAPAMVIAAVREAVAQHPLPRAPNRQVVPMSACERVADGDRGSYHRASGQDAWLLEVTAFRPSAPGAGQVEYSAYHQRMSARYKTLEVQRVDEVWQVTRVLKHVAS